MSPRRSCARRPTSERNARDQRAHHNIPYLVFTGHAILYSGAPIVSLALAIDL